MSCYHPVPALRLGKGLKPKFFPRRVDYNIRTLREKFGDDLLLLPCGHCVGCQIDKSREWAVRIMLEASLHQENCFLTLTFDDDHLPPEPTKRPLQLFMKRLRKFVGNDKIRFFACGELGEHTDRFHLHVILFGYRFADEELLQRSSSGMMIYKSKTLDSIWQYGLSSIGEVTGQSASYVARYVMKKKLTGIDRGEFVVMSRRPGIGSDRFSIRWFDTSKIYGALGESSFQMS